VSIKLFSDYCQITVPRSPCSVFISHRSLYSASFLVLLMCFSHMFSMLSFHTISAIVCIHCDFFLRIISLTKLLDDSSYISIRFLFLYVFLSFFLQFNWYFPFVLRFLFLLIHVIYVWIFPFLRITYVWSFPFFLCVIFLYVLYLMEFVPINRWTFPNDV